MAVPIPPEAVIAAKKILTYGGPIAAKELKKYLSKDHGSKVKMGTYQECPIGLFGDRACIVANADNGEYVLLTSDTIQSCSYVKEKRRFVGLTSHTYFYYSITFKDGSESYVRMRRKYRDAMLNHM